MRPDEAASVVSQLLDRVRALRDRNALSDAALMHLAALDGSDARPTLRGLASATESQAEDLRQLQSSLQLLHEALAEPPAPSSS